MKRIIYVILLTFLICFTSTKVYALSADKNSIEIEKNKSEDISLYAYLNSEVSSVEFTLTYSTYDFPAGFTVNSLFNNERGNATKHKIVFDTPKTGKIQIGTVNLRSVNNPKDKSGTININNANALTSTGEKITLSSQSITVTLKDSNTTEVKEEVKQEEVKVETIDKNMLEKINSDIVNIDLKKDVFEYNINVSSEVETLDLTPILKDETYKIDITSQKINELQDGKIIISVSKDDFKQEYKINVKVEEQKKTTNTKDSNFVSTYKYKGKWVSVITVLTIILVLGLFIKKKK